MFRSARAQNGKLVVVLLLLLLRSKDLYCLGGGGGELGCLERAKDFKMTEWAVKKGWNKLVMLQLYDIFRIE